LRRRRDKANRKYQDRISCPTTGKNLEMMFRTFGGHSLHTATECYDFHGNVFNIINSF
jgi:hypothetical protein